MVQINRNAVVPEYLYDIQELNTNTVTQRKEQETEVREEDETSESDDKEQNEVIQGTLSFSNCWAQNRNQFKRYTCLNQFSIGVSPSAKDNENEVGETEIEENVEGNFVTFSCQTSTKVLCHLLNFDAAFLHFNVFGEENSMKRRYKIKEINVYKTKNLSQTAIQECSCLVYK